MPDKGASASKQLKVAIIGAGPAGLGAAIELAKRPFIDFQVYEKKPGISEIGNGLTIQPNTWRMLEHLGAAHHLGTEDFFRPANGHITQHRNGRTGQLVNAEDQRVEVPPHREGCRAHRAKLQQALLKQVDQSRIRVGRNLVEIQRQSPGRLRLTFKDGFTDDVDLIVGADGIRSIVRQYGFPDHKIEYTGATAYRTIVRTLDAMKINGIPREVVFWHGTDGKWVYTCPLGGNDLEITARIKEPGGEERASWGRDASVSHFVDSFREFCPPILQLLGLVTYVQQFDYFAGPRLNTSISCDGLAVLVGDASHPLSGAFGGGAGFALEDAYALGGAIEWAVSAARPLSDALKLFDDVRTPHYNSLYDVLDGFAAADAQLMRQPLEADEEIEGRIEALWGQKHQWMYYYEVEKALVRAMNAREEGGGTGKMPDFIYRMLQ